MRHRKRGYVMAWDGTVRSLMVRASFVEEVEEARARAELLLEDEHALVLEHPADVALGIEQVAEDARARRAGLEARGQAALPRAVQAEGALLDHALRPQAVGE